jgi:hypothetical protein
MFGPALPMLRYVFLCLWALERLCELDARESSGMRRVRMRPRSGRHVVQPGTEVASEREKGDAGPQCRSFSFAPSGPADFPLRPRGLRSGLHSIAASRLGAGRFFHSFQTRSSSDTDSQGTARALAHSHNPEGQQKGASPRAQSRAESQTMPGTHAFPNSCVSPAPALRSPCFRSKE